VGTMPMAEYVGSCMGTVRVKNRDFSKSV
jgi:hypothetical protein